MAKDPKVTATEQQAKELERLNALTDKQISAQLDVTKLISKTKQVYDDILKNQRLLGTEQYKQVDISEAINELQTKYIKSKKLITEEQKGQIANQIIELKNAEALTKNLDEQHKKLLEQTKTVRKIVDLFTKPIETVEKLGESIKERVTKRFLEASEEFEAGGKNIASISKFIGAALGTSIVLVLLKGLHNAMHLQEEINDISKSFGTTYKESYKALSNLEGMTVASGIIGANTKDALAAYTATSTVLGTNAKLTQSQLNAQLFLTKQLGFSADESAVIAMNAEAVDGSFSQQFATVENLVKSYNEFADDNVNVRNTTKQVLKLSNSLRAAYKNNTKELTMAVIQANKLGVSLDRTKEIADGYLSIDESIQKEMEARVLTGKNINLNQARYLALQGKSAEAVAEATKEFKNYQELANMAPYQQKALAAALNMTTDELLQQAKMNELDVKNMKELTGGKLDQLVASKKLTKEEANQYMIQNQVTTAQERLADLSTKLLIVFDKLVAGPLTKVLDILDYITTPISNAVSLVGQLISGTSNIKDIFGEISPLVAGIGTTLSVLILPSILKSANVLAGEMVFALGKAVGYYGMMAIEAITTASAATLGLGLVAIIAGIGAGAIAMNSAKSTASQVKDGAVNPNGGLVVSRPEGGIIAQGIKDDNVVFTTNDVNTAATNNEGIDPQMSEMISLLKQILTTTSQPAVIKIGNKTIEEMDSRLNLRKNYNIGADNQSYRL